MQQFSSLLSWRLFTAQHVSGVLPPYHQELNDCSSILWFYLRIVVTVVLCSWLVWKLKWWLLILYYTNKRIVRLMEQNKRQMKRLKRSCKKGSWSQTARRNQQNNYPTVATNSQRWEEWCRQKTELAQYRTRTCQCRITRPAKITNLRYLDCT
jgi:hypothetical protein